MPYILENELTDSSFIERDIFFSFKYGTKLSSTCDSSLFFYNSEGNHIILPGNAEVPPVDFESVKCVCELINDDNDPITISIQEKPDASTGLSPNSIVQKPMRGFSVGIKVPKVFSLMFHEAEIKTPDNSVWKIGKGSENFAWNKGMLLVNVPVGINYFIRMRPRLDFVEFPWTNWLPFSATRKHR